MAPDRQHVVRALLIVLEHGGDHILRLTGLEQGKERMFRPVRIPQREHGIVRKPFSLMQFMVEAPIEAVHVHVHRRIDHRMVQRGVEHRLFRLGPVDIDTGEFPLPGLFRLRAEGVERLPFRLRPEILQGTGGSGRRKGDLDGQFRRVGGIELEPGHQFPARHFRKVVQACIPAVTTLIGSRRLVLTAVFQDRTGELHREIGVIRPGPSVRDPVPRHKRRAHHADFRPKRLAVVIVDAMVQVQDQVPFRPFRIGISMDANALGSSQFHLDAGIRQRDLVMPGACRFGFMIETLPVAGIRILCGSRNEPDFPGSRHEQDISEVGVSRAAEMRVAETHDRAVTVLVAGAVLIGTRLVHAFYVVRDHVRVRRQLYAPEGDAGAREGMPHTGRADKRVHIVCPLCEKAGGNAGQGP